MEKEHTYCNILDQLYKENNKLANFFIEQCMSSMITRKLHGKDTEIKVTFLLPPESSVNKLLKMNKEEAKQQLKRHIIRYFYNIEKLKTKTIINSLARENFNISAQGDKVYINNVEVTDEMTPASNGIILKVSDLLNPGEEIKGFPKGERAEGAEGITEGIKGAVKGKTKKAKGAKGSKKKAKGGCGCTSGISGSGSGAEKGGKGKGGCGCFSGSGSGNGNVAMRGGSGKMYGGLPPILEMALMNIDHPVFNGIHYYDSLSGLSGINLRWNIMEHYRKKWPLSLFPINTEHNYYYWLYASLLSYLEKEIDNFYSIYEPCVDPIIGVELLLQPHLTNGNYLVDDNLLLKWYNSNYWLIADPVKFRSVYGYILGGGSNNQNRGGGGDQIQYIHGSKFERKYIDRFIQSVNSIFDNFEIPEQKKRIYLVETFKEIEASDDFRPSSMKKLYKKVDKDYWYLVPSAMSMQSYMIANYHNPFMSMISTGGKKKVGDISGGLMYSTSGGAKDIVISIDKYEPTKYDELMCTLFDEPPKDVIYSILQPHKARDYRFKLDLIKQFVNSPFFISFDQPKIHTFMKEKKYYVKRSPYSHIGNLQILPNISQPGYGADVISVNTGESAPTSSELEPTETMQQKRSEQQNKELKDILSNF
jgi:hypothetical protein